MNHMMMMTMIAILVYDLSLVSFRVNELRNIKQPLQAQWVTQQTIYVCLAKNLEQIIRFNDMLAVSLTTTCNFHFNL